MMIMDFTGFNSSYLLIVSILMSSAVWSAPTLTISPSPAEDGDDVQFTCEYMTTGQDPAVFISSNGDNLCWYAGGQFLTLDGRVVHNPQNNYRNMLKFTLKNVTVTDRGHWKCQVDKDKTNVTLDVYVPPRNMRVFMVSQPPYTESIKESEHVYSPTYTVNCTFSAYPADTSVLWPNAFIHNNSIINEKKSQSPITVLDGNVYNVTLSASFPLTKEDNGEKSLRCEVTWRRGTEKERIYTAQLETPLNVTFSATNGISMSVEYTILMEHNITTSPKCMWGSANPPKPIKWIFTDSTVSADNIGDKPALPSTSPYEAGEFHGQTTVSRLTVTRELNQRNVSCCVLFETSLHCKHSGVLMVNFPPTTANITTSRDPIVGENMTLTCTTDSSHPHSNITWNFPEHHKNDTMIDNRLGNGHYEGTISISSLTLEVQKEDLQQQFNCSLIWNGEKVPDVHRTYILGAKTTSSLVASTTPRTAITTEVETEGSPRANKRPAEVDNTNLIIGLAVGLGGAVILITVILAMVIVRGKRRKQRQQGRADNAVDKNPETAHDYETVDEELNEVPDGSHQISMIEPEPDYADIGNGNSYTETPVSDPPTSPPETLSQDDEMPTYAQVNKSPSRRLPDVVSPGEKRDDPDYSDEEPEGPPVSERRRTQLGEPAIVPAEAEQPPTDEQKRPEIKKTKPVVDKSKKPRKPGKKPGNEPEDPYSEIGDRTPNVVTKKSEPNYAEVNPSQKKNVVPSPTERTEYGKVDFSQDHENDEDVTGDTDSD